MSENSNRVSVAFSLFFIQVFTWKLPMKCRSCLYLLPQSKGLVYLLSSQGHSPSSAVFCFHLYFGTLPPLLIFKCCVLQFKDHKDKPSLGGILSDSPAPCPAFWAGPTGVSFPEAAADGRRRQPVSSPLAAWQHQPAGGVWQAEEMAQEAAQTPSPAAVQWPLGSDRRQVSHDCCGPCPLPAAS